MEDCILDFLLREIPHATSLKYFQHLEPSNQMKLCVLRRGLQLIREEDSLIPMQTGESGRGIWVGGGGGGGSGDGGGGSLGEGISFLLSLGEDRNPCYFSFLENGFGNGYGYGMLEDSYRQKGFFYYLE